MTSEHSQSNLIWRFICSFCYLNRCSWNPRELRVARGCRNLPTRRNPRDIDHDSLIMFIPFCVLWTIKRCLWFLLIMLINYSDCLSHSVVCTSSEFRKILSWPRLVTIFKIGFLRAYKIRCVLFYLVIWDNHMHLKHKQVAIWTRITRPGSVSVSPYTISLRAIQCAQMSNENNGLALC